MIDIKEDFKDNEKFIIKSVFETHAVYNDAVLCVIVLGVMLREIECVFKVGK